MYTLSSSKLADILIREGGHEWVATHGYNTFPRGYRGECEGGIRLYEVGGDRESVWGDSERWGPDKAKLLKTLAIVDRVETYYGTEETLDRVFTFNKKSGRWSEIEEGL